MDSPPPTSTTLPNLIYILASSLTTLLVALGGFFFLRRQRSADVHKTNADTRKLEAESRQIDSTILLKAYERLDDLESVSRQQAIEITRLNQKVMQYEYEQRTDRAKIKEQTAEIKLLDLQVQRARRAGFLAIDKPGMPNPAAAPEGGP